MKTRHLGTDEVLQGEMVYIRPPRFEELSFVRRLWAHPETMAPVGGTHRLTDPENFYERMVDPGDSANCYCLIFSRDNVPLGEISFHRWDQNERSAELNIKVHAVHRGHGYGSDALRTFLDWFFRPAGGNRITDNVALANLGGQHLLRSLGFQQDPDFSDTCMLVLTRQKYMEHRGMKGK